MLAALLHSQPGRINIAEVDEPVPGLGQVAIEVSACGVCRTDLHILDAELADAKLPLIPGHQIVGRISGVGPGAARFKMGERVGVPWLGWTCGECRFCLSNRENLCLKAKFTGYDLDGGYAEVAVADERFCFPIPDAFEDIEVAPLLCGGMIGFRALSIAGDGERLGFYGFGSSAHILCQIAVSQGRRVFAFTRAGDIEGQRFALDLGAEWAGESGDEPPEPLDAAIVFAPVGSLMVDALRASDRGARIVSAGIHMSDIPSFPYELLWEERSLHSVANLTRKDGDAFLPIAAKAGVRTSTTVFPLERVADAFEALRSGEVEGSLVVQVRS